MRKISNAKHLMLLSTSRWLTQNAELVGNLPGYSDAWSAFSDKLTQLQAVCGQLQVSNGALSAEKQALRNTMAGCATELVTKVQLFAKVSGNLSLYKQCSFSKTDLYYAQQLTAASNALAIYEIATAQLTELDSYGVTQEELTLLKSAIDAFVEAIPLVGHGIKERKELLQLRDSLIAECETLLETIDLAIKTIKATQAAFYRLYMEHRRVQYSFTSLSLQGNVTDADTGESVRGVSLLIEPDQSTAAEKMELKTSSDKGGFRIKSLPEGCYTLTANRPGYVSASVSFTVSTSERSDIAIRLKKTA